MKIIIVGAGQVGKELVKRVKKEWEITIIDNDENKLKQIIELLDSGALNRTTLIQGDGTSKLILKRAGLKDTKVFVACTGDDEANLEACRIAKEENVPSIFAVSNHIDHDKWFEKEGIECINKAVATASLLERRISSGVVTATNIGLGKGEIVEVTILPTSMLVGYPVTKFSSRRWKIAAIYRDNKLLLPSKKTIIKPGDKVLIIGEPKILKHIVGLIRSGEAQFPAQFGSEEIVLLKEDNHQNMVAIKDATFMGKNTKINLIAVYTCFNEEKEHLKQIFSTEAPDQTLKIEQLKLCEKEFIEKAKDEDVGIIVLPDIYKEFPLFFGKRSYPIEVAEETVTPVLIGRGTTPYKKILVPVSGSFNGYRALEIGIEISLQIEAEISVVYVTADRVADEEKIRIISDKIIKFANLYKQDIKFILKEGNPVTEVAKLSKKFDLVIIGARKGKKSNWFNPYPPYHMVHRTKCSTLLTCVGE